MEDYYNVYNTSNGEFIIKVLLKMIFPNHNFEKSHPEWLKSSKTGSCLEIDLFNEELNLGIEYNGYHHYIDEVEKFHPSISKGILRTIENDTIKNEICKEHNFKLISVPFRLNWANVVNIKVFLKEELTKFSFKVPDDFVDQKIPIPSTYLSTGTLLKEIIASSQPYKNVGEDSLSFKLSSPEFEILFDNETSVVKGFFDEENDINNIDPDIIRRDSKERTKEDLLRFIECLAIRNSIITSENRSVKRENKKLKFVIDLLNSERYKLVSKINDLIMNFSKEQISLQDISDVLNSKNI